VFRGNERVGKTLALGKVGQPAVIAKSVIVEFSKLLKP